MIEFLKDPLTVIEKSNSLFKITRADDTELERNSKDAKQEKLAGLKQLMETLYPDREIKSAKAMLFLCEPDNEEKKVNWHKVRELQEALEEIIKHKQHSVKQAHPRTM